jgi:hypothetical protein
VSEIAIIVRQTLLRLRDWVSTEAILTREGLQLAINRNDTEIEALLWSGFVKPENGAGAISSLLDQIDELDIVGLVENELLTLESNYPAAADLFVDIWPMDPKDNFGRRSLRGISATTGRDGVMSLVIDIHEYHHHLRHERVDLDGSDETLLSRLIFEGLAEHFVVDVLGQTSAPWIATVSDDFLWSLWPRYLPMLKVSGSDASRYLFGDSELGLPKWIGYSIGFLIVQRYRQIHSDISINELTSLPAEMFIPTL